MIFPGMDPYLEASQLWPGVHSRLVVYIADQLQPVLHPRYLAAVEERIYVEGPERQIIPDVWIRRDSREEPGAVAVAEVDSPVLVQVPALEVHETYIAILDRYSGQQVVTVIEVISPSNKYAGPGRDSYVSKQVEIRGSSVHLVEIDLLRGGQHVASVPEWVARGRAEYDYLTCTNRAGGVRDRFELYPTRLRDRLPRIRIPLASGDPDVPLDLQAAVARVYEAGSYRDRINYESQCVPGLRDDDQAWAKQLVAAPR